VIGAAAGGTPRKRIWIVVMSAVLALAILTIVLQSTGLAPAMKIAG